MREKGSKRDANKNKLVKFGTGRSRDQRRTTMNPSVGGAVVLKNSILLGATCTGNGEDKAKIL